MAALMCATPGHGPATVVVAFTAGGDTVRLCDECLPNFCAAVFEQMTGVDMTPALYLASEEGQADRDALKGDPAEVAYPPMTAAEGAPTDDPPAPAPHDTDPEAAVPPTGDVPTEASATAIVAESGSDATSGPDEGPPPGEHETVTAAE